MNEQASFKLTKLTLKDLSKKGIPEDILEKLQSLEGQRAKRNEFLDAIERQIGRDQLIQYKGIILRHAHIADNRIGQFPRDMLRRFRLLTSEVRTLPDFVILGGQRCGTSSLYAYLSQHPQILPAIQKEIQFFSRHFPKGVRWYRARFPLLLEIRCRSLLASKKIISGEASPYYLFHPQAPKRLAAVVPKAKLIVLLRNPIDRAYSHYHLNLKKKREALSFEEAVASESARLAGERDRILADESYKGFNYRNFSYLQRGIYVDQLQAYAEFFDRDQILVIKSEDFFSRTPEVFQQILEFLGLEPYIPGDMHPRNASNYSKKQQHTINKEFHAYLQDHFRPHNQRLYEYLDRDFGW